jgi:hypothetical protein
MKSLGALFEAGGDEGQWTDGGEREESWSVPEREGDRNATGIKIGAATDVLTTD